MLGCLLLLWLPVAGAVQAQAQDIGSSEATAGREEASVDLEELLIDLEARRQKAEARIGRAEAYFGAWKAGADGSEARAWQAAFPRLGSGLEVGEAEALRRTQRHLDHRQAARALEWQEAAPPGLGSGAGIALGQEDRNRWRTALEAAHEAERRADALLNRFLELQLAGLKRAPGLQRGSLERVRALYEQWMDVGEAVGEAPEAPGPRDGRDGGEGEEIAGATGHEDDPQQAETPEGSVEVAAASTAEEDLEIPLASSILGLPLALAPLPDGLEIADLGVPELPAVELDALAIDMEHRLRLLVGSAHRAMAVSEDRGLIELVEEDLRRLEARRRALADGLLQPGTTGAGSPNAEEGAAGEVPPVAGSEPGDEEIVAGDLGGTAAVEPARRARASFADVGAEEFAGFLVGRAIEDRLARVRPLLVPDLAQQVDQHMRAWQQVRLAWYLPRLEERVQRLEDVQQSYDGVEEGTAAEDSGSAPAQGESVEPLAQEEDEEVVTAIHIWWPPPPRIRRGGADGRRGQLRSEVELETEGLRLVRDLMRQERQARLMNYQEAVQEAEKKQATEPDERGAEEDARSSALKRYQAEVEQLLDRFQVLRQTEDQLQIDFDENLQERQSGLTAILDTLEKRLDELEALDVAAKRQVQQQAWQRLNEWVGEARRNGADEIVGDRVRAKLLQHRFNRGRWTADSEAWRNARDELDETLSALKGNISAGESQLRVEGWQNRLAGAADWLEERSSLRRSEEELSRLLLEGKRERRQLAMASGLGFWERARNAWKEIRQEWSVDRVGVEAVLNRLRYWLESLRTEAREFDVWSWLELGFKIVMVVGLLALFFLPWRKADELARRFLKWMDRRRENALRQRGDSRWGRRPLAGQWTALQEPVKGLLRVGLEWVVAWLVLPLLLPSSPFVDAVLWLWLTLVGVRAAKYLVRLTCAPAGGEKEKETGSSQVQRPALFTLSEDQRESLALHLQLLSGCLGVLGFLSHLAQGFGLYQVADILFWNRAGSSLYPLRSLFDLVLNLAFGALALGTFGVIWRWRGEIQAAAERRQRRNKKQEQEKGTDADTGSFLPPVLPLLRLLRYEAKALWRGERAPRAEKRSGMVFREPISIEGGNGEDLSALSGNRQAREWRQLRQHFESWSDKGPQCLHAVVGDRGMGKDTFLERLEKEWLPEEHTSRPVEKWDMAECRHQGEADVLQWLAEKTGLSIEGRERSDLDTLEEELEEHLRAKERKVLLLNDVHCTVLRTVGGYDALRRLLDVCHATADHHFWVLTFSRSTWDFLDSMGLARLERFAEPVRLRPLSGEDLRQWLAGSEKARALQYEPLLQADEQSQSGGGSDSNGSSDGEAENRERCTAFWEHLAYRTGGNPQMAEHFWPRALTSEGGSREKTVVRWVEPGHADDLTGLTLEDLQLLTALHLHDGLEEEYLPEVLNRPWTELRVCCRRLSRLGIIESPGDPTSDEDRYRIHIAWWQAVDERLRRGNYLSFTSRAAVIPRLDPRILPSQQDRPAQGA